jgi:hypothetical protein
MHSGLSAKLPLCCIDFVRIFVCIISTKYTATNHIPFNLISRVCVLTVSRHQYLKLCILKLKRWGLLSPWRIAQEQVELDQQLLLIHMDSEDQ